jgi:lipopolysaccharide/colanic/teichoic acid biosynthesis glycosyltransferase
MLLILVAGPVLLPLMAAISALIKIVSPGPALFRQVRIGYRGQTFTCFKFRTMKVNADTGVHQGHFSQLVSSNAPMRKLDGRDPRVIPCGLALRTFGLDELPQIFNVLRGEMSLVGPRPCLPYEYKEYTPRHRRRFEAVPGLTGLWQVSGKNRTTFERMVDLDIEYGQTKSLWLDLRIIFMTIPALLIQTKELKNDTKTMASKPTFQNSPVEQP